MELIYVLKLEGAKVKKGLVLECTPVSELISLVEEFLEPVVLERISDDRMRSDSFKVKPTMFRDGYGGIKNLIQRINNLNLGSSFE